MEFYERIADIQDFFVFDKRNIVDTYPHFHGSVEILIVAKGSQQVVVNGESALLNVGEGCFSDSYSVHAYDFNPQSECYIIIISKGLFDKIIGSFNNKIPETFFKFNNFKTLDFLLDLCNKSYKNSKIRENSLLGAMEILFSIIFENNSYSTREKGRNSLLVKDILTYTENNLTDDLSLDALSKKFNYSKEHLSRLLHKYLNVNWATYVSKLRVDKAHQLIISENNLNICDIAFMCGFESTATFYRAYKKEYSVCPRQKH